jgi:hypothetical protein
MSHSIAAAIGCGLSAPFTWSAAAAPAPSLTAGESALIHFDAHNLIVQANGDGADTAQREGMYWFARGMYRYGADFHRVRPWITLRPDENDKTDVRRLYRSVVHQFLVRDAGGKLVGFRRHPKQANNSDPAKMSRDQLLPLIAAMSVWDDQATLKEVYDYFANQPGPISWLNSDWMDVYRQYIRRARNEPVEDTLDKTLLDGAVEARLCCIDDADNVGDDLNLLVLLTLSEMPRQKKDYIPAIRRKFTENRPMNYGIYLGAYYQHWNRKNDLSKDVMVKRINDGIAAGWQPNCSSALGAIRWYCRSESGGSPGLARMLRPIAQHYLAAQVQPAGTHFQKYNCGPVGEKLKGLCQKN